MPNLDPWINKQVGNNKKQNTKQPNEIKIFLIIYYHIDLKIKIQ
jgi:hypothetical protein